MAADVVLNGAFFSASNLQLRFQAKNAGSILLTSGTTLKLDDEVNPALVMAMGSYGAIGATEGTYKASGEISAPTQIMTYIMAQLAAADPKGTKSPSLTEFTLTGIISNGIDANYKLEARRCRAVKLNDDISGGDPKALVQTIPLLIIDGIYRNGNRLINPVPTRGIR